MADEKEYKPNTSIYNGVPIASPEQQARKKAEQRARQACLPKLKLAEGEELYIDRETVKNLNHEYFKILEEMGRGFSVKSFEDLESYMNSVVLASYQSEILKLQRDGAEKARPLKTIRYYKNQALKADYVKDHWWQRKAHPNDAMRQLLSLADIEASMEFAARAAEIERQKEFLTGEPDLATEYFYIMLDSFVPSRKRKRFIKQHYERITRFLSEYAYDETPDRLYTALLNEFASAKKLQQFEEKNGEYLKVLISNFIETYTAETEAEETEAEPPADDTAEPTEQAEALEDTAPEEEPEDESEAGEQLDLSEFEEAEAAELAKQAATSEQSDKAAEEVAEEPVQEQMQLPPVAVAENTAPQTAAELAEPTEQAEASETANEPAETANADVETGNEE